MNNKRKLLGFTATAMLLAVAMTGCNKYNTDTASPSQPNQNQATTDQAPADPTVLNFGTNEDIPHLDPDGTAANTSFRETYVIYDRLVTYSGTSTEVQPMLAKSWDVSSDGKTYTFHLRDDVKFHDGTPFTADAVKYSFTRAIKVGKSAAGIFDGIADANSFEVVDPHTIKIHLLKPYAGFVASLGTTYADIINPKLKDHEGSDLGQTYLADHEMGSGPYTLKSWDRGQKMVLSANNDYWGGKPTMQTVNINIVSEPSTARLMIEKGQLDVYEPNTISPDVTKQMATEKGIEIHTSPGFQINDVVMNVEKKPFDNKLVRQAFAYAVDYDSIIKSVYGGNAIRVPGIIPKGMFGYNPDAKLYNYDPEKAKQLLQQAGVGNGLNVEMAISTNNDLVANAAVILQANLAKVGVNLQIKQMSWPTFLDTVTHGGAQMAMAGWTPDYADPDYNLWYFADSASKGPGFNLAFYENKQVDQLLADGRTENAKTKREQIYKQVQSIMADEVPYIFLAQMEVVEPSRSWVKGLDINPMNTWYIPFNKITKQ